MMVNGLLTVVVSSALAAGRPRVKAYRTTSAAQTVPARAAA